jgi:RimJ/RimL family protein N-acetyltransferase
MKISFKLLSEAHFTLLLKWLEAPQVKAWWDKDVQWTLALVKEKYADYVTGYKLENGMPKPINAYIIYVDNVPIGYIQIYNAYDFARAEPLIGLPSSLGAFDIFIGEENYLRKGVASKAIIQFLKEYGTSYSHIFVDPEKTNLAAIRTYEKAGFKKVEGYQNKDELWMIK